MFDIISLWLTIFCHHQERLLFECSDFAFRPRSGVEFCERVFVICFQAASGYTKNVRWFFEEFDF